MGTTMYSNWNFATSSWPDEIERDPDHLTNLSGFMGETESSSLMDCVSSPFVSMLSDSLVFNFCNTNNNPTNHHTSYLRQTDENIESSVIHRNASPSTVSHTNQDSINSGLNFMGSDRNGQCLRESPSYSVLISPITTSHPTPPTSPTHIDNAGPGQLSLSSSPMVSISNQNSDNILTNSVHNITMNAESLNLDCANIAVSSNYCTNYNSNTLLHQYGVPTQQQHQHSHLYDHQINHNPSSIIQPYPTKSTTSVSARGSKRSAVSRESGTKSSAKRLQLMRKIGVEIIKVLNHLHLRRVLEVVLELWWTKF